MSSSFFLSFFCIAAALRGWLKKEHVQTHYIEPGSPVMRATDRRVRVQYREDMYDREDGHRYYAPD